MPFINTPIDYLDDVDSGKAVESGVTLPWSDDPTGSYLYYECTIGTALDSGIVVHNRLPQVDNRPDTLGSIPYDDPNLDLEMERGVNLKCLDQYRDIVQRMGHSRYWFRLWGRAVRVGYKVPIPYIKIIAGVPAIPYDKNNQWAFNRLVPGGNLGGIPVWAAGWSQWYTTDRPPVSNNIPVANPSALFTSKDFPEGNPVLPKGVQVPISSPDDNSTNSTSSILSIINSAGGISGG